MSKEVLMRIVVSLILSTIMSTHHLQLKVAHIIGPYYSLEGPDKISPLFSA